MDEIDLKILACLQDDGTASVAAIAERVGLSPSPCWRRIDRLQANGVIRRRVALLDPQQLNVGVTAFVSVRTNRHSVAWSEQFCRSVKEIPEVVEFYRLSGPIDYLLKIVVPDIAAYDAVYKQITTIMELFDVTSSFAMEQIKHTTALPLRYALAQGERQSAMPHVQDTQASHAAW